MDMKTLIVTLEDIKAIKSLMDEVDSIKDANGTQSENGFHFNGKESLIEAKEAIISKNIHAVSSILCVPYNTVVDMCYDFDFAEMVISDKSK